MRAGQIASGHEKLVDDLAAGEDEGLFEEFRPFVFGQRVMSVEPTFQRTELFF